MSLAGFNEHSHLNPAEQNPGEREREEKKRKTNSVKFTKSTKFRISQKKTRNSGLFSKKISVTSRGNHVRVSGAHNLDSCDAFRFDFLSSFRNAVFIFQCYSGPFPPFSVVINHFLRSAHITTLLEVYRHFAFIYSFCFVSFRLQF